MITPWVLRLMLANGLMFVLQTLRPGLERELSFVPAEFLLRPWTLVTYMFLHGGFLHIFMNMLGLFFFGPRLELELGSRGFVGIYFTSGMTGALLSFVHPMTGIIGASGAVYGVMLGFAAFWPRAPIYVWGVLPVEARTMVVVLTLLSLWGGLGGGGDGIAHFGHLGGFLGGYLFLRFRRARMRSITGAAPSAPRPGEVLRWRNIPREHLHPVNREELDRILAKLEQAGPGSLTDAERGFLDRFSRD
ncbi:MAG: rhomboid family intramembrane serine protease [Bacteroidota bacterium]